MDRGRGFHERSGIGTWRQLALHTWSRPSDPSVYGFLEVEATRALAYVERAREASGEHVTLTHLVGKAVAIAIGANPEVNAIVTRGWHVQERESVDVFFQVAMDDGKDLSGAKVVGADQKSVVQIGRDLREAAERVRRHRDPALASTRRLLRRVPGVLRGAAMRLAETATYDLGLDLGALGVPYDQFGSAMVTNVGVFGLPAGFAPLVPFARTPILLTLGTVADRPVAIEGRVEVRPVLPIGATFDHRILDGALAGDLARSFLAVLSDPSERLGEPLQE